MSESRNRTSRTDPLARNTSVAARLHWALLPSLGAYYAADAFGEKVPLLDRLRYALMRIVERLPNSNLYPPLETVACDCDYCRGLTDRWTP